MAAHREVRRRQGPRHRPVQRPARLHLGRPGLLPRQAGARLRPLLHHARRRPPRLRRPDERHVRRLRRRAGQEPRDPHRPDGQPAARRASRCGCPSGPARSSRSTTWSTRSASTPAATPWRATPTTPTSTSTSTCGPRPATTTPSTTCSTPTRAPADARERRRPRDALPGDGIRPVTARPREGGRAAARAGRVPARRHRRRRAARAAPGGALPRGHGRGLPPVVRHQDAGCCRWATSRSPTNEARLVLVHADATVLANGLGLLGVSAPERM